MSKKPSQKARYRRLFAAWESGAAACLVVQARQFLDDYPHNNEAWALYGIGLYEMARYKESTTALRRTLKLGLRGTLFCCVQMGHLHREKGEYSRAAQWYRKASKQDPDDAGPHIFLGAVLAKQGLLDAAEKAHRRAIQCTRGCVEEAFLNLGFVLLAKEQFEEALTCFQKALELQPEYPAARVAKDDVTQAMKWLRGNG